MNLPHIALPKIANLPDISRFAGLAAPVVAIAVSIMISTLVTYPKFSEVLKIRTANSELSVRLSGLNEKVGVLSSLAANREELELQLAQADQLLPSDKNVFSTISQLEHAVGSSGVLLSRLEVSPGAIGVSDKSVPAPAPAPVPSGAGASVGAADIAPKISLKLAMTSDYRSFLAFMSRVLSFSRVVSVSDLSLAASSTSGKAYQIRSSLTVHAFWQPLPGELASVELPIEVLTSEEKELLAGVQFTAISQLISPIDESVQTIPIGSKPVGKSDIFAPTF